MSADVKPSLARVLVVSEDSGRQRVRDANSAEYRRGTTGLLAKDPEHASALLNP